MKQGSRWRRGVEADEEVEEEEAAEAAAERDPPTVGQESVARE